MHTEATMPEPLLPLTPEERERRAKSIASIRHSQRLSGGDVSPYAQELFQEYIEGRMTMEQIRQKLFEYYGVNPR